MSHRGIGAVLAGLLLVSVAARVTPSTGSDQVVGRLGGITVTATTLHRGPATALTSQVRITTTAPASDQLDAALAAGTTAVAVYHRQVSVGEISELASCDGQTPSAQVVSHWLHYGPLMVPGRSYGRAAASATLSLPTSGVRLRGSLPVTLYFAHTGHLTLDLPITT